jgi:hypothetical protein
MSTILPFLAYKSQPNYSYWLEIEYIAIDSHCLCEPVVMNNSLPFDVTKALTLPSVCGIASPGRKLFLHVYNFDVLFDSC